MGILYNNKLKNNLRKNLRNKTTRTEIILWKKLKNKQVNGYKFRRQYGIGRYVVDFYCPELYLAIEVDGANHFFDAKSSKYDLERQRFIESLGIRVLRLTTTDIYHNLNNVLNEIYKVTFLPPPRPPL